MPLTERADTGGRADVEEGWRGPKLVNEAEMEQLEQLWESQGEKSKLPVGPNAPGKRNMILRN